MTTSAFRQWPTINPANADSDLNICLFLQLMFNGPSFRNSENPGYIIQEEQ